MTDVVVRRCTASVVRRGGWTWGFERQRLVDEVLALVPEVVLAELGAALEDDELGSFEVFEPLTVTVTLGLDRLLDGSAEPIAHRSASGIDPAVANLSDAIRRSAAGRTVAAGGDTPEPGREAPRRAGGDPEPDLPWSDPGQPSLFDVLADHHRRGRLVSLLASATPAVVAAWLRVICGSVALAESIAGPGRGSGSDRVDRVAAGAATSVADIGGLAGDASWLAVLVATAVSTDLTPDDAALIAAVRRVLGPEAGPADPGSGTGHEHPGDSVDDDAGLDRAPSSVPPPTDRVGTAGAEHVTDRVETIDRAPTTGPAQAADLNRLAAPAPAPAPAPARRSSGPDPHVFNADVPVLPFLLLGPLAELGLFDAVSASFLAADAEELLPAFGSALAFKTLSPPERGWRRAAPDHHGAAAFAGRSDPVASGQIAALAADAALLVDGPATLLASTLAERRSSGDPVAIGRTAVGELVVADAATLAVLEWATPADSAAALGRFEGFAVTEPSSDRHLLMAETVDALDSRPAAPLADDRRLERALGLVAGVGLALVADRLWAGVEPTDPLLVFERLGDLEGSVRGDRERVEVRLPLGRRRADLFENGLMDEVEGVSWLQGRPVVFTGG